MIKWSWKRGARPLEPRLKVNPRLLELQTAKQILEEIFHARPSDAEEMIKIRLDEKSWNEDSWREEDESWPASFSVDE
jgi:hypothetical protein